MLDCKSKYASSNLAHQSIPSHRGESAFGGYKVRRILGDVQRVEKKKKKNKKKGLTYKKMGLYI